MSPEPTFDQTLTTDGITVRLHRVGGKLTVEVTDPAGALRSLEVRDTISGTELATVSDLGNETRAQNVIAPMLAALDKMTQDEVDLLHTELWRFEEINDAHEQLWRTTSKYNGSRNWGDVMGEVRDTCAHRGLEGARTLEKVFVAAANRDLIGTGAYTQAQYDLVTYPWRILVGPIHPDDAEPHGRPELEADIPQMQQILDLVENHWMIDEDAARTIESQAAARDADLAVTVAQTRGIKMVKDLNRIRTLQWTTLMVTRRLTALEQETRTASVAELHRAALGLVLRDQSRGEWSEFAERDYFALTSLWRAVVGPVHPDDDLPAR